MDARSGELPGCIDQSPGRSGPLGRAAGDLARRSGAMARWPRSIAGSFVLIPGCFGETPRRSREIPRPGRKANRGPGDRPRPFRYPMRSSDLFASGTHLSARGYAPLAVGRWTCPAATPLSADERLIGQLPPAGAVAKVIRDGQVTAYDVRKVKAGNAAADSTLELAEEMARNL